MEGFRGVIVCRLTSVQQFPVGWVRFPTKGGSIFDRRWHALAVRRNDADFRLVADRVISDLYRSKQILEVYDRWIGKFTRQRLPIFDALIQLNATPE